MELWDSSGSDQYEACWPAMQRDAHGVIFVFNPDSQAQAKHLDSFHQAFVQGEIVCYKAAKGIDELLEATMEEREDWLELQDQFEKDLRRF